MGSASGVGEDKQYSLMQVSEFTENHPYWGTLRQPSAGNGTKRKRLHKDRGHTKTAASHKGQKSDREGKKIEGRRRKGMSIATRGQEKDQEKRFGVADPIVWDAINRSLEQQQRLSSLIVPGATATQTIPDLEVPSRTSSQRKTLNRFTRQLEKYADVAGAAGKIPVVTPTESESKVSYNTVQPLLPYRNELRAAGLAVTSAEQSRKPDQTYVGHQPGIPGDFVNITDEFDGQKDPTSRHSSLSSGSFIEFSPEDGLIESLSPRKIKSKQKSAHKEKRGILPWLRKKPVVKESCSNDFEPQGRWQLVKDDKGQRESRATGSQNPHAHRDTYTHPDLSPQVAVRSIPTITPPKLPSTPNITSPEKPSFVGLTSTKVTQGGHGRRSEPIIAYADYELKTKQPETHTGLRKRDVAGTRKPRPETIDEEQETWPSHTQTAVQENSQPQSKIAPAIPAVPVPTTEIEQSPQNISPNTTPSTIPSLPYPARYASGRPSSLQRALDEVSQQLDKMEQEADNTDMYCRPPTLVEKTNQKEQLDSPSSTAKQPSKTHLSRRPHKKEKFIYVSRTMPPVSPCQQKPKAKSGQRLSKSPPRPLSKSTQAAPSSAEKQPPRGLRKEHMVPKTAQTQDMLNDTDVFLDYDDADINDRDVIKGLQVAIHAAADNRYDALVRDKTGLRIRRFLADLRAVGEMPPE